MTSSSVWHHGRALSRRIAFLVGLVGITGLVAACGAPASAGNQNVASTPSPTAVAAGGQITLAEFKVSVPTLIKGGTGTFHIVNGGTIEHELLVFKSDRPISAYPTDSDGRILEEDPSITKISDGDNIAVGASQDRAIELSSPGTYVFVCNLPGHYQQGMYKVVTVTS